jgi:hypothetical protein
MPPLSRHDALAVLEAGQGELDALFDELSDSELDAPGTIGAGDWAAKDLMGHIALWEELALETIDAFRGGLTPRVATASTDALNADNQAAQAPRNAFDLRARAADAHAALLAALHSLTDAEWHAPPTWPNAEHATLCEALGGVLGAPGRPFGHAYAHLDDLRAPCVG